MLRQYVIWLKIFCIRNHLEERTSEEEDCVKNLNNEKRYVGIDNIKGVAIILMVFGHSIAGRNLGMADTGSLNIVYDFIYSFHMSLFFAASGFLYRYGDDYFRYIGKKAQRLLIPYFFFCFAMIIMRMILPGFTVEEASTQEMLLSILLYGGNLWFLYVLFFIFLIFPLLDKVISSRGGTAVLFVLIILEGIVPKVEFFLLSDLLFYLIPFTVGRICRLNNTYEKLKSIQYRKVWLICGFLIHIALFAVGIHLSTGSLKRMFSVLLSILGCLWVFLMIVELRWSKLKHCFRELGSYSLPIYLFNGYFIAASRILMRALGVQSVFLLVVSHFVFGLIINYWVCRILLKFRLFALLCGGSVKRDSKV